MLEKILKRFGYVKEKTEIDDETKQRLERINKQFSEMMTYTLKKAARGDK